MNERYLFRGKRSDDLKKDWVTGNYISVPRHMIVLAEPMLNGNWNCFDIDPATLGQCTGLRDRDGKLIFEGDFVSNSNRITDRDPYFGVIRLGHYRHLDASTEYECGDYGFYIDWIGKGAILRNDIMYWLKNITVAYTIHDNQGMLEEDAHE